VTIIIIVIHIGLLLILLLLSIFFFIVSNGKLSGDIYNFAGDIVLGENIAITTNGTIKTKEGK